MRKRISFILLLIISFFSFSACEEVEDAVNDVQKTAALRNVSFTYDSLTTELVLPQMSLSGKTFQELYENNKAVYGDPSNYAVKVNTHYTAENTSDNAADAMFSGMIQDVVFNSLSETPLRFDTPAFDIPEGETTAISSNTEIGLSTHQQTVMYIFRQIVAEEPLSTQISSKLNYELGIEQGSISLPQVNKNIPTKASEETKAFIQGLLNSGLFAE